jgi:hypothetical protein
MDMENSVSIKSTSANVPSSEHGRREALVAKLMRFYSVMGHRPEEPGALALMANILTENASDDQINRALTKCGHECRYPVRLPDILLRIPGQEIPQLEAEWRKAWDVVTQFVEKYVSNDVHGNYGPEHGWYPKSFPRLSQRVLDTVRRTGGWKVYKCMTSEDYPHQQKRFFEEYNAWSVVERVESDHLLTASPQLKQLVGTHAMETREETKPAQVPVVRAKRVPQPLADTEIRDRREVLRQQAARCRREDTPSQSTRSCSVAQQESEQQHAST